MSAPSIASASAGAKTPGSIVPETLTGLTTQSAAERLKVDGYNELPAPDRRSLLRIVWEVLRQPMFALLIGGGVVYLLLGDRTEALLLLGLPLILTPIHIAFLEMVIDPACSIVFEAEAEEEDVMRRPPRNPRSPLLLPRRIIWALLQGLLVLAALAGLLVSAVRAGLVEADLRALVFASLVLTNLGLILVNRSFTASLLRAFLRPNRSLWILVSTITVVLSIAVFWPPAQALFHFGPLHANDLAVCAALGVSCVLLLETLKSRWFRSTARAN